MNKDPSLEGEQAILLLNEHWIKYSASVFMIVTSWVLYILCIYLSVIIISPNHLLSIALIIIGHIFLLVFHHAAFYHYFSISTRRTLITNKRILSSKQRLWFSDDTIDIPLWRIRSIEVKKTGLLQQLLDSGSLVLNGGDLPSLERIPQLHTIHATVTSLIHDMQPALERKYSTPQSE